MEDPIIDNMFVTLVSGLVVAFYAAKRYDTPETNRLTTTRSLFLLTRAGYIAASLALFLLLCEVVLKPGVLPFLGLEHAKEIAAKFSAPPVLAAVLLTTLLPNTVIVSAADAWLLKRFQAWGRIPQGVRDLADTLTQKAFPVVEADLADLRAWITSNGDVPNELATRASADTAETPRGCVTRVLRLFHELEKLAVQPDYANAFRVRQEAWQAIRTDFRVFVAQSQAFFALFDHLMPMEGTAGEDAIEQAGDRYRDICRNLHGHMVEFLAQLLLIVEGSDLRIQSRLQSVGFRVLEAPCPPLPIGPFIFMGAMMVVAILGIVAVVPPPGRTLPLAIIAMLIGTTQTVGLLAAIVPKLRWSAFRPNSRGNLPYLAWLESASVAAIVALLIDRTALAITNQTVSAELDFSHYPLSPMGPMAFAVSLSIAIICDIDLRLGDGWARRVTEGMLCGAAMAAGIFICTQLLDLPPATRGQAPSWFPFVFSFSLGFASGFVAPSLYRRARGEEPVARAAAFHAA